MAVQIAELEGAHATGLLRQGFWTSEGNRPHASRANPCIGRVHIRYDNGEVLEPEIGAAAVRRVGAPWAFELGELDPLIAELHRQHVHCFRGRFRRRLRRQAEQGDQRRVPQVLSCDRAEIERVAVEALGAVEVRNGQPNRAHG